MKTLFKRIVIQLYNMGLIEAETVVWAFNRFNLWRA